MDENGGYRDETQMRMSERRRKEGKDKEDGKDRQGDLDGDRRPPELCGGASEEGSEGSQTTPFQVPNRCTATLTRSKHLMIAPASNEHGRTRSGQSCKGNVYLQVLDTAEIISKATQS
jgi:hypothetical protein